MLAVDHDDEAGFLAAQKLLHHHPVTRFAEGIARQHVTAGGNRLVLSGGENHALARGQAVGLDDDRRALGADIPDGLIKIGEVAVSGGRYPVAREKILSEGLGAFQHGGRGRRPEHAQSGGPKTVHNTGHQRRLGADDGQNDRPIAHEGFKRSEVFRRDGHVFQFGLARRSGVAGCHVYALDARGLRGLPCERVLAAAAADDQYFHWQSSAYFGTDLSTAKGKTLNHKVHKGHEARTVWPVMFMVLGIDWRSG